MPHSPPASSGATSVSPGPGQQSEDAISGVTAADEDQQSRVQSSPVQSSRSRPDLHGAGFRPEGEKTMRRT
ncbi:hypothetical protein INR49_005788 [Caranx melampygus]|nr:hypothetical protein INR49_005788 [Caranx melampygus]